MREKVAIDIDEGTYSSSHKNGAKYTSVGCQGKTYGQGSPCDSPEEVKQAIEGCKRVIRQHGDVPFVRDNRESAKLSAWL